MVYTRIWVDRNSERTPFLKDVIAECNKLKKNGASRAVFGDALVSYGSRGICLEFRQRLLKVPAEFAGLTVTNVTFDVSYWQHELFAGEYKRRRSNGTVTKEVYADGSRPDYWRFVVEGESFTAANRLFEDIVTRRTTPRIAYSFI